MNQEHKVSVGFPLYNSEQYLDEALKCLVEQDYENIAINICDNASTDGSREIYESYAQRDSRIRIFRSPINIGPGRNFEKSFQICDSPYFMWAACDDRRHPSYISRCVEALNQDPQIALAYTFTRFIDDRGKDGGICTDPFDLTQESPVERFKNMLGHLGYCNAFYGVYRSAMLAKTTVFSKPTYAGDVHLLMEVLFLGKLYQIPEILFYRNMHNLINHSDTPEDRQKNLLALKQGFESTAYPPGYGLTMLYFEHIWRFFEIVQFAPIPNPEKPELIERTREFVNRETVFNRVRSEVDRAINCILKNEFYEEWNPSRVQIPQTGEWMTQMRPLYMSRLLQLCEKVLLVYPNYRGIQAARAICLSYLGRFQEAKCAVECEIRQYPNYAPAREIYKKIQAALQSQSQ